MNLGRIVVLTDQQIEELVANVVNRTIEAINAPMQGLQQCEQQREYRYGLRGICELFDISPATAMRYKSTFLKPAIEQRGRKIRIDVALANQLFSQHQQQDYLTK